NHHATPTTRPLGLRTGTNAGHTPGLRQPEPSRATNTTAAPEGRHRAHTQLHPHRDQVQHHGRAGKRPHVPRPPLRGLETIREGEVAYLPRRVAGQCLRRRPRARFVLENKDA
ncbi:unnamed protein product, partial [Amoebophrya sp. A120]